MSARILVIDDDPFVTQVLAGLLKQEGYEVDSAPDGFLAMPAFQKFSPDLVILDYRMPAASGAQVLDKIRRLQAGARTPVIFVTVESPESLRFAVSESSLVKIWTKAPNMEGLLALVREMLGPKGLPPRP